MIMAPKKNQIEASPFFAPSTPRKLLPISTPGGTFVRLEKKEIDKEHKASVLGTSGNLINAIVGAGIVGIPFAIRESGLVAGLFLVVLCAFLTEKSLRLLIETAKHIDVPSYEVLAEASFGTIGFYFISLNMLVMSYGAMISYLMIIKDTLPILMGVSPQNVLVKQSILAVSSFFIVFPLSCQRDMADLAKTSSISVIFDCLMVIIVATNAPISENVYDLESAKIMLRSSFIYPKTLFTGLGVLSFAFVCQHSAFIIAGSLKNPVRRRWGRVTSLSLFVCALLASTIGVTGYIGFQDKTEGNILNNFTALETMTASNTARALLCTTMFFVYPMESFVCRHVFVVLFFQGRRAHEGDDHSVLARVDRRIGLTLFLYICALIPAIIFEDLGSILSITGAIGGSCLSYIGPGASYLAIHAKDVLEIIDNEWPGRRQKRNEYSNTSGKNDDSDTNNKNGFFVQIFKLITWYIFLMPIWCKICETGEQHFQHFQKEEALKSPHINRLGKVVHKNPKKESRIEQNIDEENEFVPFVKPPIRSGSFNDTFNQNNPRQVFVKSQYGSIKTNQGIPMTNKKIAQSILAEIHKEKEDDNDEVEGDAQDNFPTWADVIVAILFIGFGVIAFSAGLVSIYAGNS